ILFCLVAGCAFWVWDVSFISPSLSFMDFSCEQFEQATQSELRALCRLNLAHSQTRSNVLTRCPHPEHPFSPRSVFRIPMSVMFV
ncbi:hypothetical protein ACFLUC_03715, partial [Chloroflexota bacterium]